jgi:hypothetical protein
LIELASTGSLTVSSASLDAALTLVDYQKRTIAHLLRTELATTESGKRLQRVLQVVTRKPGVNRKGMLQATGYNAGDLTPLLDTLTEREDVTYRDSGYWPAAAEG